MGAFDGITISTSEYRPCLVDGKKALFHRWSDKSKVVEPSPMIGGAPGGTVRYTVAIVEMEDGQVIEVGPQLIKFIDRKIEGDIFNE